MVDQYANTVDTGTINTRSSGSRAGRKPGAGRRRGGGQMKNAEVPCRFYASKAGCRAGADCPYLHDPSVQPAKTSSAQPTATEPGPDSEPSTQSTSAQARAFQAPPVSRSKVVSKPVPKAQTQDPRKFQIDQLTRRFNPSQLDIGDGTTLTFRLVPSDPDFPFDLDSGLQCILFVPKDYPGNTEPSLKVTNKEMGRGFQINVEKGFENLARYMKGSTLLGLINNLDRQLETLLTGKGAETVKIVRNVGKESLPELEKPPPSPVLEPVPTFTGPIWTPQQLTDAENKRKADTRQLEARLGRQPHFEKAASGLSYMLPIEPRKRQDLPVPLQKVTMLELTIPPLYPLETCTVRLFGVQQAAAENTESAFEQYVKKQIQESKGSNLLTYLNYLATNMHILATKIVNKEELPQIELEKLAIHDEVKLPIAAVIPSENAAASTQDEDRPHIHHVARPPEWDAQFGDQSSESDTDDSFEDDSGYDVADHKDDAENNANDSGPERGIMLSLPYLELHGIELLELVSMAITLRCTRCKDTLDVDRLRHDAPKIEMCKKCSQAFGVGFRRELLHTNSVVAGYLDLDGCTVVDLLPSQFIPTCAECSTAQPPPGVVSVRAQSSMAICRECHHRMSFNFPEVKFLQVSATAGNKHRPPPRRKVRENLGITAGSELPDRGRCEHYRKSYRWFRFSCCQKVFACDKCHDNVSDHLTEFANRMLCGWCSREQLYRPETCAFCRNNVIGKKGGGFWEGGKGTRDKNLMSRKDPRKFKRRTGVNAKVGGSSSKK